jgi:hypothetical protein
MDQDETEKLIEVWKVLHVLTVSMRRIGEYWLEHGEEAAKEAMHQFMGPPISEQLVHARRLISDVLENHDPTVGDRLEAMAEDEAAMGYWDGPRSGGGS